MLFWGMGYWNFNIYTLYNRQQDPGQIWTSKQLFLTRILHMTAETGSGKFLNLPDSRWAPTRWVFVNSHITADYIPHTSWHAFFIKYAIIESIRLLSPSVKTSEHIVSRLLYICYTGICKLERERRRGWKPDLKQWGKSRCEPLVMKGKGVRSCFSLHELLSRWSASLRTAIQVSVSWAALQYK